MGHLIDTHWPVRLYCHLLGLGILSISHSHFPIFPFSHFPIPKSQAQAQSLSQLLDNSVSPLHWDLLRTDSGLNSYLNACESCVNRERDRITLVTSDKLTDCSLDLNVIACQNYKA